MEYMGNREYWEDKFAKRGACLLGPEGSLIDSLEYFKEGRVLDLACGDGRNALFLLEQGFKVTGVDFSGRALERLRGFAAASNYDVTTLALDLDKPGALDGLGVFDNILINHYRLRKDQLAGLDEHLAEGGLLFISGFGPGHPLGSRLRQEDLIDPADFQVLGEALELLSSREEEDERGSLVTYLFRKKPSQSLPRQFREDF